MYEPRLNDTSKGDISVDTEPVRGHCAGALFLRHTRPLARPALFMLSQPRIRHLLSLCCSSVPSSWLRCGIRCIQSQHPRPSARTLSSRRHKSRECWCHRCCLSSVLGARAVPDVRSAKPRPPQVVTAQRFPALQSAFKTYLRLAWSIPLCGLLSAITE